MPIGTRFASKLPSTHQVLRRGAVDILQVNVGRICNLTCTHCHVNAGPKRKEIMSRETIDRVLAWLENSAIATVDITGGAPEMIPDFRYLIERVKGFPVARHIIDRCNLTILLQPEQDGLAEFLAGHRVEIIASLPCYSSQNVDEQRGEGVFAESIAALQLLNQLGYGRVPELPLHLVYNPNGAQLPGPQEELECAYKQVLHENFGISFHRLFTITNMPLGRFGSQLRHEGAYDSYMEELVGAFNPLTLDGLMCRHTLNVGWRGEIYDCDFNQMLRLQWQNGRPLYLWDIAPETLEGRPIMVGDHCFGCTAGCGSSCGGALL